MKKIFTIVAAATMLIGCAETTPTVAPTVTSPAKLSNSSTHTRMQVVQPVVALLADLEVSPTKITYFFMPSQTIVNGGFDNIVNSAVREALIANGNADVLVGLEQQVKYSGNGAVESITVSGYPAKYVNFRSPGDEYLRSIAKPQPQPQSQSGKPQQSATQSILGGLLGK